MVAWTLLGIGICSGMFIFHNHLGAQLHHLCRLVKVIGKISIMLEINTYPVMLYCPFALFLMLLGRCWLLWRPDRHRRTDCLDDSIIIHNVVSNI